MRILTAALLAATLTPQFAAAEPVDVVSQAVTDWKAVYGRIEARDRIPARSRLGGTLTSLSVAEGDTVAKGDVLARVEDEKLQFQLSALEAQRRSLDAQLGNAEAELQRGETMLERGITTVQRLDSLRTQVDVVRGQIQAVDAQAQVVRQQAAEGAVLAPVSGRVLDVPVAEGSVVMPGEEIALVGGGGTFLRLAVPERLATMLDEGDVLSIEDDGHPIEGQLVRIYPLIESGRVIADVDVAGLSDRYVDKRVLVRLPVGTHDALTVPATAILTRDGLDFVAILPADGKGQPGLRTIQTGQHFAQDGVARVEVLSGLRAGDRILADAAEFPVDAAGSND